MRNPEWHIENLAGDRARRQIPARDSGGNLEPAVGHYSASKCMLAPVAFSSSATAPSSASKQENDHVCSRLRLAGISFHRRDDNSANGSSGSQDADLDISKAPPGPGKTRFMPDRSARGVRAPQRMSRLADVFESSISNVPSDYPKKCSREQRTLYHEVLTETGVHRNE